MKATGIVAIQWKIAFTLLHALINGHRLERERAGAEESLPLPSILRVYACVHVWACVCMFVYVCVCTSCAHTRASARSSVAVCVRR